MILQNKKLLVSGADYFNDAKAINAHMDSSILVDLTKAKAEHQSIVTALRSAGIEVIQVPPPEDCQDGIYTANWGLVRNNNVLLSRLPNSRQPEEPYAREIFSDLGVQIRELPPEVMAFSGQGDSIAIGDTVFCQSPYRTSANAHPYLKEVLGFNQVIALQTRPARLFKFGPAKKNAITGWPDSPTYDIDLAIAAIKPGNQQNGPIIAYCPSVFKAKSRKILKTLQGYDKIIVSKAEAMNAFALNLVSTGEIVVMNAGAPLFKAELEKRGLKVIELELHELKKGGGSIRCCSLTLD